MSDFKMKWHPRLYIGERAGKKAEKLIWKVDHGAGMTDVYLLTMPAGDGRILEIVHNAMLLNPVIRANTPVIVGIGKGYDEALQLLEEIVRDTWRSRGDYDVVCFLKN